MTNFTQIQIADLGRSGITAEQATKVGLTCITDPQDASAILNWKGNGQVPALSIPYYPRGDRSQSPASYRLRPDTPRIDKTGKVAKYLQPKGVSTSIYIPPSIDHARLYDSLDPLIITEGEKKALAAVGAEFLCIAAPGVWNFHDAEKSNKTEKRFVLKQAMLEIPWRGRPVFIAFDALKFEKRLVLMAEAVLAKMLHEAGADVRVIDLPRQI